MKTKLTPTPFAIKLHRRLLLALALALPFLSQAAPFGSAFTYQGRLNFSGTPAADGLYDFKFSLHDAATLGSPIGVAVAVNAVPVTNGLFTAQLDFGAPAFTSGEARWLQLQVNTNGASPLAGLNPRQRLAPTPQAIYAGNAATASAVAPGAITSSGLAPGSVDAAAIADGSIGAADLSPGLLNGTFWKLGGNSGAGSFLGSIDNQLVELRVNNQPALRLLPNATSPNVVGGHAANFVNPGNSGAFIGGGGSAADFNIANGKYAAVVGGIQNRAFGDGAFIGGGSSNRVEGNASFVGGGLRNVVGAPYATVAGGSFNSVFETNGTIAGGSGNTVSGDQAGSTIGGGRNNFLYQSQDGTIAGGLQNHIKGSSPTAVVGGGYQNFIETNGANGTIAGGYFNLLTAGYATIGGGRLNSAHGASSTIGGGATNQALAQYSTVAGGSANRVAGPFGVIAGGADNETGIENYSSVGGGQSNLASFAHTVIGGGKQNRAQGFYAVIAGGSRNTTGEQGATVGGGANNEASGHHSTISGGSGNFTAEFGSAVGGGGLNHATGLYSTVPGGDRNTATGSSSLAAGHRAKAITTGSFVWADSTEADFASTTTNQFAVRANNGVMIQSTNTALDLRGGGAVRVAGAGVNTATPVFIHRTSATSVSGHLSIIDHPLCNGDINAILIITHNFTADAAPSRYETQPVGVWYNGSRWTIFHEDNTVAMPINRAFNVMVIKP